MGDVPVVECVFSFLLASAHGNPTTEVASDSQGDLLRTSANSLLTQPQGKAQEAIHLLVPGRPSGVQQTCSSTGLELVLGRDTLGAPLHDGSL